MHVSLHKCNNVMLMESDTGGEWFFTFQQGNTFFGRC